MKYPACGVEYEKRILVSMTDSLGDIAAMTFHQFIINFPRRCTSKIDVRTDNELENNDYYIYLHSLQNTANLRVDVTDMQP